MKVLNEGRPDVDAVETSIRAAVDVPPRPVIILTLFAIAFRLLIFVGRGDYVAFDEGWYLLLGRNLFAGDGYTLTGLHHVTLSPLFPILAGAFGMVIPDAVWAGRSVAAVAAGLLVWPCWHIFTRLSDRRTAWLACVFIAVMPALAPFAAPYWIRWDLWVGSEPILHLFLYAALALALRGWQRDRSTDWLLAGCLFALAYLARSEAVLPFGIVAIIVAARAVRRRSARAAIHVAAFGLAFALTAAPYWVYLHDALDHWTLTGRAVSLPSVNTGGTGAPARAAHGLERMLWQDDARSYMYALYSLDPSATRLSSTYWGIPRDAPLRAVPERTPTAVPAAAPAPPAPARAGEEPFGRLRLYARALAIAVPWYLLPFIILGVTARRRSGRDELLVATPLLLSSAAIAAIVAVDPRTQLFVAPLAAYYAARGVRRLALLLEARPELRGMRPGFAGSAAAVVLVALLAGTALRWVYLGVALGSPHHLVGTANRQMGRALRGIVPPEAPVMSWHPAIALYARRDWRVLPGAPLEDVVRYADATATEFVVVSRYYPAPALLGELPADHLVLHVPPGAASMAGGWRIDLRDGDGPYVFGRLQAAASGGSDD